MEMDWIYPDVGFWIGNMQTWTDLNFYQIFKCKIKSLEQEAYFGFNLWLLLSWELNLSSKLLISFCFWVACFSFLNSKLKIQSWQLPAQVLIYQFSYIFFQFIAHLDIANWNCVVWVNRARMLLARGKKRARLWVELLFLWTSAKSGSPKIIVRESKR